MLDETFMFTVGMLSEITGGNKQYLSKKIKKMIDDPDIRLKALLKSNKEGYQIAEDEVLRCFDKITPAMLGEYKKRCLSMEPVPKVRMLTEKEDSAADSYLRKENEMLIEWKVRLAAASPEQKDTQEMRGYLLEQAERIAELKKEKLKEYVMLEMFIENCDKMIEDIHKRLES